MGSIMLSLPIILLLIIIESEGFLNIPHLSTRRGFSLSAKTKGNGNATWRIFNVELPLNEDPGKDNVQLHDNLLQAVKKKVNRVAKGGEKGSLQFTDKNVKVVRKSFDGRWKRSKTRQPSFVYTVDVKLPRSISIKPQGGKFELLSSDEETEMPTPSSSLSPSKPQPHVVVVGFGPAGLFAALRLIENGMKVTVIERGQPVEVRGRDIGALINRRHLLTDSNFCFGEGGAGTWSDGKLTTRIGKNSGDVRSVLRRLVNFGAPERVLVDGKPHLGTDRLVRILRVAREYLMSLGVDFHFGTAMTDLVTDEGGAAVGVHLVKGGVTDKIEGCAAVVLAIGHSSRTLYERLHDIHGVEMKAKAIASGFRIEHPQSLINTIQYGETFGGLCLNGRGPVPVADYRLVTQIPAQKRAVYSFCMCPGGQIVPTAVDKDEFSVNGMSFSKRQSKWANSGLVVTVTPEDYIADLSAAGIRTGSGSSTDPYHRDNALAGIEWQRMVERKASEMGGGELVCPVQRVPDFIRGEISSEPLPSSSYRLGVRSAPCHAIYSESITNAIREALVDFDKKLPGYLSEQALLHAVESRTSSPVQITRDAVSLQSPSMPNLYPAGEGAGYAGGIVSAAVDGLKIADAILER